MGGPSQLSATVRAIAGRSWPCPRMQNEDPRQTLKRVGAALIVVGALDVGYMIFCIMHRISYSSSFNIFAVICGIFVWRGQPWFLKWVPRACAFFAALLSGSLILSPSFMPLPLQAAEFRNNPLGNERCGRHRDGGITIFFWWIYRQLRRTAVLQYFEQQGLPIATPRCALIAGAALAVRYLRTMRDR